MGNSLVLTPHLVVFSSEGTFQTQEMHLFLKMWTVFSRWSDWSDILCHIKNGRKVVSLQALVPFQGCFEKVEEWLDDNKHLLGTIGMVILVVQVGKLNDILFFLSYFFLSLSLFWLHLFVSAFVATCFKNKARESSGLQSSVSLSSSEKVMRSVLGGRSRHPLILKCCSHCVLHPDPVWENQSYLALCQAGCSHV